MRFTHSFAASFLVLATVASAQQPGAPWPMERQDRWGTGRALTGPSSYSTPWISYNMSVTYPVSHGPCLAADNIAYYGDWVQNSVHKFRTDTLEELGAFNALNFVACTPAIYDANNLLFTTENASGRLFNIDTGIMDFNWFYNTGYVGGSPTIGPDGNVVASTRTGVAYRWNALTGDVVWSHSGLGAAKGSTVFTRDDTKVIIANGNHLTALRYSDGGQVWDVNLNSPVGAPGVAPNGTIVVGTDAGNVKGINPDTGATVWAKMALAEVRAAPAFADGVAYVGSYDHRLYAFDTTTGTRLWSFTASYWIESPPCVGHDGRIYIHTKFGDLYCVSPSGEQIWTIPLVGESRGPMTIGPDGTLYVGRTADDSRYSGLAIVRQQPGRVTGRIVYNNLVTGAAKPAATLELRLKNSTEAIASVTVTPDASGDFVADLPVPFRQDGYGANGQYSLSLKVTHWVRRTVDLDLHTGQASDVLLNLINGDVNGDNQINLADLTAISRAWRTRPGDANWNPNADLNGDGSVNLADWTIVSRNWRISGDQ